MSSKLEDKTDRKKNYVKFFGSIDDRIKFYSKADDKGDCIIWIGGCRASPKYLEPVVWNGYNKISVCRFLLEKRLGRNIKEGYWALHTCDRPNGPCINIDHLYEGTPSQNIQDSYDRGRRFSTLKGGEEHPRAKLTEQQAREIKAKVGNGASYAKLSRKYGVSPSTIYDIGNGRSWSRVQ